MASIYFKTRPAPRPLEGATVLDASRMLPGAITARMLGDLGARIIKVESPHGGDPMRNIEPRKNGIGAAFRALYRGAESICLDLKQNEEAEKLRRLAGHADVFLESFRPGTLAAWGVSPAELTSQFPRLVICSLSSFGQDGPQSQRVAHDINLLASSGLLSLLATGGVPRIQLVDVTAGLLASSAILAGLLGRERTGRGGWIDQPLSTGPLPFLAVATAENALGGGGSADLLLSGRCPAYRLYECGDGKRLAVGALEPKFWLKLVDLLDLREHAPAGVDSGEPGATAANAVEDKLATRPRDHWMALFDAAELPVTPVLELEESERGTGMFMPFAGEAIAGDVPTLGEHTGKVLAELDA